MYFNLPPITTSNSRKAGQISGHDAASRLAPRNDGLPVAESPVSPTGMVPLCRPCKPLGVEMPPRIGNSAFSPLLQRVPQNARPHTDHRN